SEASRKGRGVFRQQLGPDGPVDVDRPTTEVLRKGQRRIVLDGSLKREVARRRNQPHHLVVAVRHPSPSAPSNSASITISPCCALNGTLIGRTRYPREMCPCKGR